MLDHVIKIAATLSTCAFAAAEAAQKAESKAQSQAVQENPSVAQALFIFAGIIFAGCALFTCIDNPKRVALENQDNAQHRMNMNRVAIFGPANTQRPTDSTFSRQRGQDYDRALSQFNQYRQ